MFTCYKIKQQPKTSSLFKCFTFYLCFIKCLQFPKISLSRFSFYKTLITSQRFPPFSKSLLHFAVFTILTIFFFDSQFPCCSMKLVNEAKCLQCPYLPFFKFHFYFSLMSLKIARVQTDVRFYFVCIITT